MSSSRLELRPWPWIAVAYLVSPLTGLVALCGTMMWRSWQQAPLQSAYVAGLVLVVGGIVCLAAELAVITPLLLAFRRHRWSWLNGWTGSGIGFLTGAVLAFIFLILLPIGEMQQVGRTVLVMDGHRTLAGWGELAKEIVAAGVVGAIAAISFRVIAVRPVRPE